MRSSAAQSLGKLEIKDESQLKKVLLALNRRLYDSVQIFALKFIRKLLNGRPIPGYQWHSLEERKKRKERKERIEKLSLP